MAITLPGVSYLDSTMDRKERLKCLSRLVKQYRAWSECSAERADAPYLMTRLGAWASSRPVHVFYFFECLDLSQFRLFLDLGSGDGRVACIASLFTRSVGIEVDERLCRIGHNVSCDMNFQGRVSFVCGDYRHFRIRKADCIYIYPDKPLWEIESMLRGWKGTLLVYGPHFPPRHFVPFLSLRCGKEEMKVYRNP